MRSRNSSNTPTRSPIAWLLLPLLLGISTLSSGCGENGASTVKAVSLKPLCEKALRVVCVSADDALTGETAQNIVTTNEAIAEGCKGVPKATQCPRGQRPRAVPEKATS